MAAENANTVDLIEKYLKNGIGCLDTRSSDEFCQCHLKNATNINWSELKDRLFELPRKDIKFILICQSNESCKLLKDYGWNNFISFNLTNNDWKILQNKNNELVECNNDYNTKNVYIPLFIPCPLLSANIDKIEGYLYNKYQDKNKDSKKKVILSCCDIGCGSGRDDIWLCLRNIIWNIDCIDFNDKMLNRLFKFSSNVNVSQQINIIKSKIRGDHKITLYKHFNDKSPLFIYDLNQINNNNQHKYYFNKTYDLVLCVRFLERSIVYKLWKMGKMIKKGGYLLIFQFMEGAEKYGHPKNKNRLLKKGELAKVFENKKMFNIIIDKEMSDEHARPIQAFLCQKLIH